MAMAERLAKVVVLGSVGATAALIYSIPPLYQHKIAPGHRVIVPVRSRRMTGIVLETGEHFESGGAEPRPIIELADETPLFDAAHLKLFEFMASYYLTSAAEAFRSVVPSIGRIESHRLYHLAAPPDALRMATLTPLERAIVEAVARRPSSMKSLSRLSDRDGQVSAAVGRLTRAGILRSSEATRGRHRAAAPTRACLAPGVSIEQVRGRIQRSLLQKLAASGSRGITIADLHTEGAGAEAALRALSRRGIVELRLDAGAEGGRPEGEASPAPVELGAEQLAAIDAVREAVEARRFETFLLWGVTGSGKTEIYLGAAASALALGRQVVVLLPEIALADQVVTSFRSRFGELVAIAHSAQNVAERWANWMAALRGHARIMIGPRSAIFAPVHDPGLIVVDEEHDPAYKQEEGIRYSARDLAVALGNFAQCPVILGSATPSAESYFNARAGRYRLLRLTSRVMKRPMAEVEIIDLRREKRLKNAKPSDDTSSPVTSVPLSARLLEEIRRNLSTGGQTLLFVNRRGYHNFLQCHLCGAVLTCSNCSVSMTFHLHDQSLRCHYCGERRAAPSQCPECGGIGLEGLGFGTERLSAALHELIPGARIARMDSDTASRHGERSRMLAQLARGEIDILVGTQMITKGFDFPGVTLVGVILADMALNMPDFRSAERTFQLLTQVAGRAGRGERAGRVLIQTYSPGHYSIRAARDQNYGRFIRRELALRRELGYPPFTKIAMVRVECESSATAARIAGLAAQTLAETEPRLRILGPGPAPIERIRGRFRWQVMVKADTARAIRIALNTLRHRIGDTAAQAQARLILDIDPINML
jgi:primosomal protein N' (replication factor Y)